MQELHYPGIHVDLLLCPLVGLDTGSLLPIQSRLQNIAEELFAIDVVRGHHGLVCGQVGLDVGHLILQLVLLLLQTKPEALEALVPDLELDVKILEMSLKTLTHSKRDLEK